MMDRSMRNAPARAPIVVADWPEQGEVHVAVGSKQTMVPQRPFGRDLFWWLTRLRVMRATAASVRR